MIFPTLPPYHPSGYSSPSHSTSSTLPSPVKWLQTRAWEHHIWMKSPACSSSQSVMIFSEHFGYLIFVSFVMKWSCVVDQIERQLVQWLILIFIHAAAIASIYKLVSCTHQVTRLIVYWVTFHDNHSTYFPDEMSEHSLFSSRTLHRKLIIIIIVYQNWSL